MANIKSVTGNATTTAGVPNSIQADGLLSVLLTPSLAGVPIYSSSITKAKRADVSETLLISQTLGTKSYIPDSVAPRAKTFSVSGYLQSLLPVEASLMIKPSLLLAEQLLNTAVDSRLPVPFKDQNGLMTLVLIKQLQITEKAEAMNAKAIVAELQEYTALTNASGLAQVLGLSMPQVITNAVGLVTAIVATAATNNTALGKANNLDKPEIKGSYKNYMCESVPFDTTANDDYNKDTDRNLAYDYTGSLVSPKTNLLYNFTLSLSRAQYTDPFETLIVIEKESGEKQQASLDDTSTKNFPVGNGDFGFTVSFPSPTYNDITPVDVPKMKLYITEKVLVS